MHLVLAIQGQKRNIPFWTCSTFAETSILCLFSVLNCFQSFHYFPTLTTRLNGLKVFWTIQCFKDWSIKNCAKLSSLNTLFMNQTLVFFKNQIQFQKDILCNFEGLFWQTVIHRPIFFKLFPLSFLILGQKTCFLGPTIFKIPQPNWYCIYVLRP